MAPEAGRLPDFCRRELCTVNARFMQFATDVTAKKRPKFNSLGAKYLAYEPVRR
jgi:hypothetical protein